MQPTTRRGSILFALIVVGLLAAGFAYTNDPIGRRLASYHAHLLESGPPARWRSGNASLRVQLPSGAVVSASGPDTLRSAAPGTELSVVQYSTLIFSHHTYVIEGVSAGR